MGCVRFPFRSPRVTDRLDLFSLRVLDSVRETGSFSRSAAALHLTTSAVSKRIAEMEARLRVRLVVRGRDGVELTPSGLAVAACAADVADRVALMAREVTAAESGASGVVRIAANTTALLLGLADDLMAFRAAHPAIAVEQIKRYIARLAEPRDQRVAVRKQDVGTYRVHSNPPARME